MTLPIMVAIMAAKAVAVVLFAMLLAAALTWADRRQGAMMQDRVGPNRAVVFIPRIWAQAGVLVPAVAAVALFLWWVVGNKSIQGAERTSLAILSYSFAASVRCPAASWLNSPATERRYVAAMPRYSTSVV